MLEELKDTGPLVRCSRGTQRGHEVRCEAGRVYLHILWNKVFTIR